jgi:4-amino-4-deoxy-L-arabinose transferase-like glycosyltransferase
MNLGLALFFLCHYGFLALFAIYAYLIGARLTRTVVYHSASEKCCFCTGLGLGVIAYLVFFAGLAHLLTRTVILLLFTIIAFLVWPSLLELARDAARLRQRLRSARPWFYGIILVLLSPLLLLPLYPPIQWDATSYHLAAARIYVNSHALVFTPYLRFPVFPQLNEMLFSLMLLLYDDITAQLVQFLMMWLVAIALYAWGQRAFRREVGLWSGVLWLSNPLVLWLGASAYIDVGLTMFVVLAAYSFFNWYQFRKASWLVLSALFFGFAAGSKYLALFPLALFGLFLLYWAAKERRFREVIAFTVIVAAVASPWYIRNLYYTGNPVWPYFGPKFGYGIWSAEDLKGQLQEQTSYGAGKTLIALIMLPWNVVFHGALFHADLSISPAYSLALPLYLMGAWRNKYLRAVFLVAVLYSLFWFSTVQILRYLLLALPFFSLAAAAAGEPIVSRLSNLRRPLISRAVTGGICVLLLSLGWYRAARSVPRSLPPFTAIRRSDFLRQALPLYPGYEFLNHAADGNYSIYALGGSNMAYFAGTRFMGDWFGPARYSSVLNKLSEPEELYRHLRSLSADYFLVSLADMSLRDRISFPAFFNGHFRLLYANPYLLLFHIEENVLHLANTADLLSNGGFETLKAGVPLSWTIVGRPLVDPGAHNSHDGNVAVRVDSDSWLVQRVPVEGGEAYILKELNRATESMQSSRLQVNWLDCQQKMLNPDIAAVPAESEWRLRVMVAVAPSSTCWADIYVSSQGDSKVWLDDVSFRRLKYQ